jgi:serine/threonine protein kinase/tetratricopeptide (TPR) repeat protein
VPFAPSPFVAGSQTVELGWVPLQSPSLVDTPPPVSKLARSSFVQTGTTPVEPIALPEPGTKFCGFELVEELGRGTFARVYLAKQAALADRSVAIKVTLKPTKEPERLARLQHTNIVPVFSVHEATPAQVICMPFVGRRTLADALSGFRKSPAAAGLSTRKANASKRGSTVAGSRAGSTTTGSEPKSGSRPAVPASSDSIVGRVDFVLPILLQLADGLAHAHDRGVLHLDLKPANVLLADTGEPMLLDFNLSYAEAEGKREVVGGTIPYMAPEQLHDLRERGKGVLDARTDLYSLGVMAFELFTGKHPFPVTSRSLVEFDSLIKARNSGAPSLRATNPDIPAAVSSIVAKLLSPKPEDRYQSARELRDDLDRQLTDRPLQFAPDRSVAERMSKWRRRNPKLLIGLLVVAALAAVGGTSAFALSEIEKRESREAETRARSTHDGLAKTRLDLLLPDPATRARGMKSAMGLLGEFGLPQDPNWRLRPAFQKVPADQQASLAADLGELLLLVAAARLEESKSGDKTAAVNDARLLNELAKGCFGESAPPMLAQQRADIDGSAAPAGTPSTARDHFLQGAALFAANKHDAALRPLEKAVAAQPNHGAANFLLGRCQHHMGNFQAAAERYKLAAALLPEDPRPTYFTGIALGYEGRHAQSEEFFAAAIRLDEKFGDAWLARGLSRIEQRDYEAAVEDLSIALERGAPRLSALYLRAFAKAHLEDDAGAAADRTAAGKLQPERDCDYNARGYTTLRTNPRAALADFNKAIELCPSSLGARRNKLAVLDLLQDDAGVLKAADELVSFAPNYAFARASRALALARLGKRTECFAEIEACRKLLQTKGPHHRDPTAIYRLGLACAATAKDAPADRAAAIKYLKEAMTTGFQDFDAIERDRDWAAIRDFPEFKKAVEAAKELAR